jgi:glutamate-1-semialdehyde aminotransferase
VIAREGIQAEFTVSPRTSIVLGQDVQTEHRRQGPERRSTAAAHGGRSRCPSALLNHGVDLMGGSGGFTSGVHSDDDIDRTVDAFEASLRELKAEAAL